MTPKPGTVYRIGDNIDGICAVVKPVLQPCCIPAVGPALVCIHIDHGKRSLISPLRDIIVTVISRRIRTETIPVPFLLYRFPKVISSLLREINQTLGL